MKQVHFWQQCRVITNYWKGFNNLWSLGCNFCSSIQRYGFSFSLFRKTGHTVGCGMPGSLLPLTVDFLGLRTNTCLTCSTCSSVTDGLPELFLLHTHSVSWNCSFHLRMELSDGGCFPNLVRNCRWTVVTDRHSWNVSTQRTGLFKMIVGVLTTCRTQYTWDRRICIFIFNRTTLHVFVTYLKGM